MATRVLIVDDHPLTRGALAALLGQNDFSVAGEAASGEEAIEVARELQPDLVLLDLSMPGIGGLGALPLLRDAAPGCEVVMLTASVAEENLLAAIRGGAAEGEAALSGSIARRLVEQVRGGRDAEGWVPDSIARALSARELEVLLLLDDHLSTDQIAARLFISEHTVRSHVKSLLRKLGVSSRRQALEALGAART